MPLLRRQQFDRQKPPADLDPEEEVFYCEITNEIFRDYEEFFERIILCNSLVWSCAVTGRSALTYQEAIESEEKARRNLESFPPYLVKPILYLAKSTHRSRLSDLNDDVFIYAKDRYFIGELVDVVINGHKKPGKIIRVIPPNPNRRKGKAEIPTENTANNTGSSNPTSSDGPDAASVASSIVVIDLCVDSPSESPSDNTVVSSAAASTTSVGSTDKPSKPPKPANLKPAQYRYVVSIEGKNSHINLKAMQLSRRKGVFTRDKSKLFLKQNCIPESGIWKIKPAIFSKYSMADVVWEEIFAGPKPVFAMSEVKKKTNPPGRKVPPKPRYSPAAAEASKPKLQSSPQSEKAVLKEKAVEVNKEPCLTQEEISILEEQERIALALEREEFKRKLEEEKQRRKELLIQERDQRREEKRKQLEYLKEWSRPREDLECDDLKLLPELSPLPSRIPVELFGDVVMVLEFLHAFSELISPEDSNVPVFSLDSLERSLMDRDLDTPLCDIMRLLLSAVFSLLEEEEEEEEELEREGAEQNANDATEGGVGFQFSSDVTTATIAAQIPQLTHGQSLRKMPLDVYTVSEVLRLHFLASGSKGSDKNCKFRYQQRGGYTSLDDPGMALKHDRPGILKALSVGNLYELNPQEKLVIMMTLINQFLTYATARDFIEENMDKLRQLRFDLRMFQASEHKREREGNQARYRKKLEEKARERERLEELRIARIKEEEAKLLNPNANPECILIDEDSQDASLKATSSPQTSQETSLSSAAPVKGSGKKSKGVPKEPEPLTVTNILSLCEKLAQQKSGAKTRKKNEIEVTVDYILGVMDKIDINELVEDEKETYRVKHDELEKARKEQIEAKEQDYLDNISRLQNACAIYPVGSDRLYRRYWTFNTIPGIFIEEDDSMSLVKILNTSDSLDRDRKMSTSNIVENGMNNVDDKSMTGSDKENDSFDANTANTDSCPTLEAVDSIKQTAPLNMVNGLDNSVKEDEEMDIDQKSPPVLEKMQSLGLPRTLDDTVVRQLMLKRSANWTYVSTLDQFESLLESLNGRGFRESILKAALLEQKSVVQDTLLFCEEFYSSAHKDDNKKSTTKTQGNMLNPDSAAEALELNLRDMLLDIEARIYVGGLSSLKVVNRLKWRDAIERGAYSPQTNDPLFQRIEGSRAYDTDMDDCGSESSTDMAQAVVRDLASALLQIQNGVEGKFLSPPLGETAIVKKGKQKAAEAKNKKRQDSEESGESDEDESGNKPQHKTTLERWQESLQMCTSLSQIYLHLCTLERSITWSKSALKAQCKICRRKGDGEKMLLCDGCDLGHHMYCLKPPLKNVPKGEWFCPNCKPKQIPVTPRKKNRRTFSEQTEEESDQDEDEDEEVEEEEDQEAGSDNEEEDEDNGDDDDDDDADDDESSSEDEDTNENTCSVCSIGGTLICCDNCPLAYHLACAKPPLKRVPKGHWQCQICLAKEKKNSAKIKMSRKPKALAKLSSAYSTPSSSQSGSQRNSPVPRPGSGASGRRKRKNSDSETDSNTTPVTSRKAQRMGKTSLEPTADRDGSLKITPSSSRSGSQVMKMCEELIHELIRDDDSWPFLKPVPKKVVPDYYDVIKIPMDFQTIRNKINKLEYMTPADLIADIRLIIRNCQEYNRPNTDEFKASVGMGKMLDRRLRDLGLDSI